MNLRENLDRMEAGPMLPAGLLPAPVNPWEMLEAELGAQEIDPSDPMYADLERAYSRIVRLSPKCEYRTNDRLIIYVLARMAEDPAAARRLVAELVRCLAILDPAGGAPEARGRRSLREVVSKAETAADPPKSEAS